MLAIRIENNTIRVTPKFDKLASNPFSREYETLQRVRRDYPDYTYVVKGAKANPNKESYKGLTYDYMREYISNHEIGADIKKVLADLDEKIQISHCHSDKYRYPVIKKWFLERYPEVKEFGKENLAETNIVTSVIAA